MDSLNPLILRARHEEVQGRAEAARILWDSLRVDLESIPPHSLGIAELGVRPLVHMALGMKDAAIGAAEELFHGEEPVCRIGFATAWRACAVLARVHAHFGEHDAAVDLIERFLAAPSWHTVHILEVDPIWDPLRNHPHFQALLEE